MSQNLEQEPEEHEQEIQRPARGSGSGIHVPGWVWFVGIYGVGNLILYKTTGIFLFPIPRK